MRAVVIGAGIVGTACAEALTRDGILREIDRTIAAHERGEHARVALENPYILTDQLRCAMCELPLHDADSLWFGPTFPVLRDWLLRHGAGKRGRVH